MLAWSFILGQHKNMIKLIALLISLSMAWGFQVQQKSQEVNIFQQDNNVREIHIGEGDLKFTKAGLQFDVLSHTSMIFNDNGLVLNKGEFRLRGPHLESFKVVTPVANLNLNGGDFIVHYWSDKAVAAVEVLEGNALIQGIYHEEVLNVQKGERGQFVGVPEADGPAYDVLLKGRKAIRGRLVGPEKIPEDQLKDLVLRFDLKIRSVVKKSKPKPKPKPGQICTEPFAQFGECVWRCRNNPPGMSQCQVENAKVQCVRERCLASGKWGDTTELKGLSKKECQTRGDIVATCRY